MTQLTTVGVNSLVVSPAVTTTYYIRGEDGAGCVDESTGACGQITVTVGDVTPPTITCPGGQIGTVNGACNYSLPDYTGLAVVADNCTASPTVTQSPVAGTNVGTGTTVVTLTVTDGSSNTANCNFNVSVSDITPPTITCPGNQVGNVDASCNYTLPDYTGLATAADNCPGATVTQVPAAGTNVGVGTTNVVLTVTDGASNSANCNFNVVVTDVTNPTIACPGNQVGSVDASCNFTLPDYTGLSTPADNCPGVTVSQVPAPGTIVGVGTTNIVLTATDGSSNTANCNFDVVTSDNTNPTITCPADQNETVNAACQFILPDYTGAATAADNCDPSPVVTQSPAPGTTITGGTVVTLTVTDASSNTSNCNFNAIGVDVVAPTAVCQNINAYLDGAGNVTITAADLDGGSTDNCGSITLSASQTAFTCANIGTNNVTLTVTDVSTNSSNCVAVVTVLDTISPVTTCPGNQTETPDAACNFTLPDYTSLVAASDNCNPSPTVTQSPVAGTVISGTTTITMTSSDGNGNSSSCTFNVVLNDATAPTAVCQNINVYLDGAGNATIVAADLDGGSTDNCSGLTMNASQTAFTCADLGPNNTTLTVTDGNANSANCIAVVTVLDTISPTVTCPGNQIENPDAACNFTLPNYTALATAADNCGSTTVTQSPVAGTVISGTTTITMTASDGNGNTSTCTFDVTLNDVAAPTAVCQNINVYLDGAGNGTIVAGDIDGGSTDNCGAVTLSASTTSFTCANLGPNNVTLTVTDGNANSANCIAVVTVIDTISPTVTCPGNQNEIPDASCNFTLPDYTGLATGSDNCNPSPTVTQSPVAGTVISSTTMITMTADDGNGNTSTCTFDVVLAPTGALNAVCQDVTIYLDGNGDASIVASDIDGGSTIPCGAPILSASQTAFTCADVGVVAVTLTVSDGVGGTANCVANVTVVDNTAPTVNCQDITVQLDGTGNATIIADDVISAGAPAMLYYTNTNGNVSVASWDGSVTPTLLYNSGSNAVGVDHDPIADDLYWSRGNTWDITTASADGLGTPVDLPNSNGQGNEHLDVDLDPANARHFFTTGNGAGIYSALMDGTGSAALLYNSGGSVNSVDYNPTNDRVYFTGIGANEVHGMDANGSNESVLFNGVDGVNSPRGIITDATTIYWVNQGSGNIMSGNIDGTGTPVILYTGSDPYHIDLDEGSGMLFWTEKGNTGDIMTAPADGSGAPTVVYTGLGTNLRGISLGAASAGVGATDNCGTPTTSIDVSTFDCSDVGTPVTVTVTATDASGNSSSCTSTVTVEDGGAPTAMCQDISVALDATGTATIVAADIDNGSTDVCSVVTLSADLTSFTCSDTGVVAVTLTVMDASGNTSTCVSNVTVTDGGAPTVPVVINDTIGCSVTPTAPIATDACMGAITATTLTAFPISMDSLVTWIFDDGNGNISTVDQQFIITDGDSPIPLNVPLADLTGECDYTGTPTAPQAWDACAGTVIGTTSDVGPWTTQGTHDITWAFDDGNGNIAYTVQHVIITDVTAPVADAGSLADLTGLCSVDAPTAPTATDNCEGSITGTTTTVFPVTTASTITWTFDDGNGNITTQTQDVIITGVDVSLTVSGAEITANNANASDYQWVSCLSNFLPLNGETNQNFIAWANGEYAVIITEAGCVDTSECIVISTIGIEDINYESFVMYPNPTVDGSFTISYEGSIKQVEMMDMLGRLVMPTVDLETGLVDGTDLAPGKYMVKVTTSEDRTLIQEVVITK
ncbi:MAG: HYR domain-containing protein [Crocinitomicaceae bacterium]|nr:HYR domain-containing protein [Crocinitomicaceae bacterium]